MKTREIKFRTWDIVEKEMREVAMLRWEDGRMARIAGYWKGTRNNGWTDSDPADGRYVLMQYTGLKDRNGTEIYEGDVVNFNNGHDEAFNVVVEWRMSQWSIPPYWIGLLTIVGDIYQNPSLMQ